MSKLIQVMVHLNHYGNKNLWIENDRKDFRVICILIHFNTCAIESFINRLYVTVRAAFYKRTYDKAINIFSLMELYITNKT